MFAKSEGLELGESLDMSNPNDVTASLSSFLDYDRRRLGKRREPSGETWMWIRITLERVPSE